MPGATAAPGMMRYGVTPQRKPESRGANRHDEDTPGGSIPGSAAFVQTGNCFSEADGTAAPILPPSEARGCVRALCFDTSISWGHGESQDQSLAGAPGTAGRGLQGASQRVFQKQTNDRHRLYFRLTPNFSTWRKGSLLVPHVLCDAVHAGTGPFFRPDSVRQLDFNRCVPFPPAFSSFVKMYRSPTAPARLFFKRP